MKKIAFVLFCFVFASASTTFAQEKPSARGLALSIGPEFVLPVGTFKDAGYKFGIGGSAKLVIPFATNLDGSISAGYITHSHSKLNELDNDNAFTTIPFKGGIRYRTNGGFYVEPQAGYTQVKVGDEAEGEFTYALNLGYLINNMVDVSARYEAIAEKGTSFKMLGLRLAYNIPFARTK